MPMKNEKAHQKHRLICEFGILMQPLVELVKADKLPTAGEYRLAIAKIKAGEKAWHQQVIQFTTFAPDMYFSEERKDISRVTLYCLHALQEIINDSILENDPSQLYERAGKEVGIAFENFRKYIDRIPIEWEPIVFEANTPFTAYLRISESIASVKHRLHDFDRYLKPDFLKLFLASVDRAVSIRLVTTVGNERHGATAVSAISNLARQEFADYRLVEVSRSDLHDRNLRVDNQIFTLGQGVDRARTALTNFGPSDSSTEAHRQFDRIIEDGRVVS